MLVLITLKEHLRVILHLNKFSVFIGDGKYVHGDMKTMISNEHFNDITLAKFFHYLGKTSNYKPHFIT